jgi:hypothetical protein
MKVREKYKTKIKEYILAELSNGGRVDMDSYIKIFGYKTKNAAYVSLSILRKESDYKKMYSDLKNICDITKIYKNKDYMIMELHKIVGNCQETEKTNPSVENRRVWVDSLVSLKKLIEDEVDNG